MAKKNSKLNIYMNGIWLGSLEKMTSGALFFAYAQSWIGEHSDFPISRKFPVREQKYQGAEVSAYFDNLLPDNEGIRERIAAKTHSASSEVFDLLSSLGRDCVGALQFQKAELPPPLLEDAKGHPIDDKEIEKIIKNLHQSPLGITDDEDFRLSLAGAQEKTAFLYLNKKWNRPIGPTATTHIFKPAIGLLKDGKDMTLSVENEWLCLEFCREMGLDATKAEMHKFRSTKVLVVERFDRSWSGKKLIRHPQEDLCQALGVSPHRKYENEGGPGMKTILKLLDESDKRDPDKRNFLKTQVIFWLLAAIDGHAKNFSIALRPGGFEFTPIYDVISADPLTRAKQLDERKIKLAMCVGKNRYYRIFDIQRRHWLETAKLAKYPEIEMEEIIKEIYSSAPRALAKVNKMLPKNFPAIISDSIFKGVEKRLKILGS
jgi:serine/threonine-protein kinase HipA